MEMLRHLYRTLDWVEVYQAEGAPLLDIPAHAIVKISTTQLLKFVLKHTNANIYFYFGRSRRENIQNLLP
jgi:hypothetical protein